MQIKSKQIEEHLSASQQIKVYQRKTKQIEAKQAPKSAQAKCFLMGDMIIHHAHHDQQQPSMLLQWFSMLFHAFTILFYAFQCFYIAFSMFAQCFFCACLCFSMLSHAFPCFYCAFTMLFQCCFHVFQYFSDAFRCFYSAFHMLFDAFTMLLSMLFRCFSMLSMLFQAFPCFHCAFTMLFNAFQCLTHANIDQKGNVFTKTRLLGTIGLPPKRNLLRAVSVTCERKLRSCVTLLFNCMDNAFNAFSMHKQFSIAI